MCESIIYLLYFFRDDMEMMLNKIVPEVSYYENNNSF